jgi:hypothetical protein
MTPHPIEELNVGKPSTVQNLTVFPLSLSKTEGPAYLTSAVAIENHGLEVTEVSEGGSVPNLMVVNPSAFCVLLLDGEELHGAKQNRIINTTVLLAPGSKTLIPVSCTEQGRWHYTSTTFQSAKTVMPVKARRQKTRSVSHSLKSAQAYHSDQAEVWGNVAELHHKVGSQSDTGAMADAYSKMRRDLDCAVEKIPLQEGQSGLVVLIDGKPAGWDLVSRPDVYADLHAQLIQSYAMEALASRRQALRKPAAGNEEPCKLPEPDPLAAKAFLERCAAVKGKDYPSVGLGTDWRFIGRGLVGSGLEVEGTWIHMACFMDEADPDGGESGSRRKMPRMSRRSQYRRRDPGENDQTIY